MHTLCGPFVLGLFCSLQHSSCLCVVLVKAEVGTQYTKVPVVLAHKDGICSQPHACCVLLRHVFEQQWKLGGGHSVESTVVSVSVEQVVLSAGPDT